MSNKIICVFQNDVYLKEFCERNGFPLINKACVEFDVHTHEQKIKKTIAEVNEVDDVVNKFNKFIKKNSEYNENVNVYDYSTTKYPYWVNLPLLTGYNDCTKGDGLRPIKITFNFDIKDTLDFKNKIFYFANIHENTTDIKYVDETISYNTRHLVAVDYEETPRLPRYPIYVISRGRSYLTKGTSKLLSRLGIPHYLVVEPNEVEEYTKNLKDEYTTILEFDTKYIDEYDRGECFEDDNITGPGPKRNFIWDHSTKNGDKWHWVMDDNAFFMKIRFFNKRHFVFSPNWIRAIEDYVDMFENVGQAGIGYNFFGGGDLINDVPYNLNDRIFSFVLNNNTITDKNGNPYRWEGRYSEDVDLSLRILKDGWCTINFTSVLLQKARTQTLKGGNTDEIYKDYGTYAKSKFIANKHSDCCIMVERFGRAHHYVNFKIFKQQLKLKPEYEEYVKNNKNISNDYGVTFINIDDEEDSVWLLTRDEIKKKYADRIKGPQQYILVDVKENNKNELRKLLEQTFKQNRSPMILTDVIGSNSVNAITELCREMKIPSYNYLYYYNSNKTLKFNDNIIKLSDISVITEKDTILYKNLNKIKADKVIIV